MPDVGYPLRTILRRHKNTRVLMAAADAVDVGAQAVRLSTGEAMRYDYLIIATGVESSYFGHPEWRVHAPGLKNLRDALEIRTRVLVAFERAEQESDPDEQAAYLSFVVVGGGPTGVELAGAIAELARHALKRDFQRIDTSKARVVLVEAGPKILPSYPPDLQVKAVKQLVALGVDVRTSTRVREVDGQEVRLGDDETLAARTVLWGAGMAGTPIVGTLGVPLDRHGLVPVTPTLNPPGMPNVFVIGDLAAVVQDGRPVPGVAPAAIQEGRYVARAIVDGMGGKPIKPFRYFDKGQLATIGRAKAVAVLGGNLHLSGFLAWLIYSTVHLLYIIEHRTRVRVFWTWVRSFVTYARGARLIPPMDVVEGLQPEARPTKATALEGPQSSPPPPGYH
jgi:NADH dehydrogenase